MRIELPELCLVALVGASGSGKSTFAKNKFKSTEVLSSDYFRGLVSDDENDQSVTQEAFDALYYIANKRLDAGKLTVIDATNVQKMARDKILKLAKEQNCFAAAIVFDLPAELCQERNNLRPDRNFSPHVVQNHIRELKRSIKHLQKEGFRYIYILKSPEQADEVEIIRKKLWNNKKEEQGPFDIIGDIHGCYDELCQLLEKLGYIVDKENCIVTPPEGRKAIFLGDFCDRGPENINVLKLVMNMVKQGSALCVPGNHDVKLLRWLRGAKVKPTHGFDITMQQMDEQPDEFKKEVISFIDGLISHYVLDDGKLVVAHAGLKEKLQGRGSGAIRSFCLYGEATGETDEFGLPVRYDWTEEYRGKATVVFGHIPSLEVQEQNNTICLDTGCVFGGKLSAWRYPERQLVQVQAEKQYYEPLKPLQGEATGQSDMLNIKDVLGKRFLSTRLYKGITVQEENSSIALEIMSRFAADPHWLIYLPPTMSPCETSNLDDYLEHPSEAFEYYKSRGIQTVVCEQKHMGSRAVITLCKDKQTAKERFGVLDGSIGIIYTRTGRHFFSDDNQEYEKTILERLRTVLDKTNFWQDFATDWLCLDTELMPWSAKAQKLLEEQYAPAGRSGRDGLASSISALEKALELQTNSFTVDEKTSGQNVELDKVLSKYKERQQSLADYTEAYRRYCWPVQSIDDYKIAPFHILATESKVWHDKNHLEHMQVIKDYMTGSDPIFMATEHIAIELNDEESMQKGVDWWLNFTHSGGEGMVVKPLTFIAYDNKGAIIQPAVKCRGKEYLRIIYGPEYLLGNHLERLKKRSLGKKRRLALSEFALGMESLERFVKREPLYKVHECVFAVLAMESEPVDPRL